MGSSILSGAVNKDGTILSKRSDGTPGFKVTHLGTGLYLVAFDLPFTSMPAVVATQNYPGWDDFTSNGGSTRDNAVVVALNETEVKIKTGDGNGSASDRNFCFIAMGGAA